MTCEQVFVDVSPLFSEPKVADANKQTKKQASLSDHETNLLMNWNYLSHLARYGKMYDKATEQSSGDKKTLHIFIQNQNKGM